MSWRAGPTNLETTCMFIGAFLKPRRVQSLTTSKPPVFWCKSVKWQCFALETAFLLCNKTELCVQTSCILMHSEWSVPRHTVCTRAWGPGFLLDCVHTFYIVSTVFIVNIKLNLNIYSSGLLSLPVMLSLTYWMSAASLLLRAPLKPLKNEVPRNWRSLWRARDVARVLFLNPHSSLWSRVI